MLYRISKTAWLKEEEHADVGHVYTRTHQLTGLNMETSEELQVSNYGIGGHYEPHFDFARREEKNAFASLGTGHCQFEKFLHFNLNSKIKGKGCSIL